MGGEFEIQAAVDGFPILHLKPNSDSQRFEETLRAAKLKATQVLVEVKSPAAPPFLPVGYA
jgi:hypothetical protein